jgi:hypothetical protein
MPSLFCTLVTVANALGGLQLQLQPLQVLSGLKTFAASGCKGDFNKGALNSIFLAMVARAPELMMYYLLFLAYW